jgi:hypothetical protein
MEGEEKELKGLKTKRREIDGENKCLALKLNYHKLTPTTLQGHIKYLNQEA